jgi:hypothetical protein
LSDSDPHDATRDPAFESVDERPRPTEDVVGVVEAIAQVQPVPPRGVACFEHLRAHSTHARRARSAPPAEDDKQKVAHMLTPIFGNQGAARNRLDAVREGRILLSTMRSAAYDTDSKERSMTRSAASNALVPFASAEKVLLLGGFIFVVLLVVVLVIPVASGVPV